MILVPLRPASLTHKNPQRQNNLWYMCPAGCKDRSINLNMCICKNNPVRLISVAVIIMAVVYKDAYFF